MTFKEYILHQLKEIKREMLNAINDLSKEDLVAFEPCGHWPIAWIVQHCCGIIDSYIYKHITGKAFLTHDVERIAYPFKIEPKPEDVYPELSVLLERWSTLLDASIEQIGSLSEETLNDKFFNHDEEIAVSCLRVINHTNAHLRNIWCILGERRVDTKWAEQSTWLA